MIELFPAREVAIEVWGWPIRWYGLLYVVALLLALWLLPKLQEDRKLKLRVGQWMDVSTWAMAGVLVGGRLGFVLLYEPYLLRSPGQIFALWQGGMSIHGGMVGVAVALWAYVAIQRDSISTRSLNTFSSEVLYWRLLDVAIVPAALGVGIGRVGNIINQELFATLQAGWLAVAGNVAIAAVLYWYLHGTKSGTGQVIGLWLIMYAVFRFFIEYGRAQDYEIVLGLSRGQWYSIPVLLAGVWVLTRLKLKD